MPEGSKEFQLVCKAMLSNFYAMIGGRPRDYQPCRGHQLKSGLRTNFKASSPSAAILLKSLLLAILLDIYTEMMNRSCFDSEHFVVLQRVGSVLRPGSVQSPWVPSRKAENYRVLLRDQHYTINKAQFQPSTQKTWRKIPTRPSLRYCAIMMCHMIGKLSRLRSMTRKARPLFRRGSKNI